jgi:hypothetical protein
MHDLISSVVIILFFLPCLQVFLLYSLFLPRNICFFLSVRFSFSLPFLHFFLPWLSVLSFLTDRTTIFSKQRGLEAIYVMGLSDVMGEESLSPVPLEKKFAVQDTCTIIPYSSKQLLYWPGSVFLPFNLENSLQVHLNIGVNITLHE